MKEHEPKNEQYKLPKFIKYPDGTEIEINYETLREQMKRENNERYDRKWGKKKAPVPKVAEI